MSANAILPRVERRGIRRGHNAWRKPGAKRAVRYFRAIAIIFAAVKTASARRRDAKPEEHAYAVRCE
jgi:hypothetical protein